MFKERSEYLDVDEAEYIVDERAQDDYFGYVAISNSTLSLIEPTQGGHPEKLAMYLRGDLDFGEETDAMRFGSVIHDYLENPADFLIDDVVRPSKMSLEWTDALFDKIGICEDIPTVIMEAVEMREFHKSTKDIEKRADKFRNECLDYYKLKCDATNFAHVVTLQEKEKLERIIANIDANPTVSKIVHFNEDSDKQYPESEYKIYNEKVILCQYGDVRLKGKLDKLVFHLYELHGEKVVDILVDDWKTTGGGLGNFANSFRSYRYYRQGALYEFLAIVFCKHLFPDRQINNVQVRFVALGTNIPYACKPFVPEDMWFREGYKEIADNISLWSETVEQIDMFVEDKKQDIIEWIPKYNDLARNSLTKTLI
jgi:hypothetical protein